MLVGFAKRVLIDCLAVYIEKMLLHFTKVEPHPSGQVALIHEFSLTKFLVVFE